MHNRTKIECPECGHFANEKEAGMFECDWCGHGFVCIYEAKVPCESISAEPENVILHRMICNELNNLYEKKNRDYGDSYHQTYLEEGMAMARIRLTDKLSRFKKLTRDGGQMVNDESVRDTLIDLANYAIMTVMEMDREAEENG